MNNPNKQDVFKTKRIISHRTKQIETRIQRQIVMEDGKVVSDSGPKVTTKTLEDTKQEFEEFEENKQFTSVDSKNANFKCDTSSDVVSNNKTKPSLPMKTYMFGYDDQSLKNDTNNKASRDKQNKSDNLRTTKYYFGEKSTSESKNNSQPDSIDPKLYTSFKSNQLNDVNNNRKSIYNDEDKVIERDCQFLYEYGNFVKYK